MCQSSFLSTFSDSLTHLATDCTLGHSLCGGGCSIYGTYLTVYPIIVL
jgi:hypothetical protein